MRKIFQQILQLCFAHPLDEILEGLSILSPVCIAIHQARNHLGNVLRRNRHHRHAIRTCVVTPLSSQDHLEVRHRVSGHLSAYAIKSQIGHVMLAATVETAADLDVQILDGFVELKILFR